MSSIMNPNNILAALNSLKSELPLLTGKEAWETIKDEFDTLKLELQDSNDPKIHSNESVRVRGMAHYVNVKICRLLRIHKQGAYHV